MNTAAETFIQVRRYMVGEQQCYAEVASLVARGIEI